MEIKFRDGRILKKAGHQIELPEVILEKDSITISDFKFKGKQVKGKTVKLGKEPFWVWIDGSTLKTGKRALKNTVIMHWNGRAGWVVGEKTEVEKDAYKAQGAKDVQS